MSRHIWAVFLVIICINPMASGAEIIDHASKGDAFRGIPNVKIEYYNVSGFDEKSINSSLQDSAPRRPDGNLALGMTTYNFRFSGSQSKRGSNCTITQGKLELFPTVHLPKLENENLVPERILARWKPFMEGLQTHEAGHIRIEIEHLPEIRAAIIGSKCAMYEINLKAAVRKIEIFQKTYDKETDDGATQGASLR